MIYTAIDNFYVNGEQLENTPSRKDGIDEPTETTLRIYGCDLIQESGILLRLPQAVMATGQVLFHRFYCKKSFVRFSVKRVAASCVWLASKLEESPRKAKQVIFVFHRMECRRENLPVLHLDVFSKKYSDLKNDLIRMERHLLKEMGFICHVEHPHKFISNYLVTLGTPPELTQEAWSLANDRQWYRANHLVLICDLLPSYRKPSTVILRTTLCVRFKSEVVACGVVYAAARRFRVPLPENPPWWTAFDADQSGIEEVCRVLAHLYSSPKAHYIPVYKDNDSFTSTNKAKEPPALVAKGSPCNGSTSDGGSYKTAPDSGSSKDAAIKALLDKLRESEKNDDDAKGIPVETDLKEESMAKSKGDYKSDSNIERNERDRERSKVRDRDSKGRDSDRDSRGRDSDRDKDREREKYEERAYRSKDKGSGQSEKSRHHSSRDHSDYYSSHSRDKDRHRHHRHA